MDLLSDLWNLINLRRNSDPKDSVSQSAAEAAQQYLANQAKLQTARDAVMLEDLRELAHADREKVRRLEQKHLWGEVPTANGSEPVGDIIICDDYSPNKPSNGLGRLLLPAILGGLLVGGGLLTAYLLTDRRPQATTNREGFTIELVPERNGLPK